MRVSPRNSTANLWPAAVLALSLSAAGVAGCFPISREYVYLAPRVPGVKYSNEICRRYGPPVDVNYELNGVAYELSVDNEYYKRTGGHFVIRAPAATRVAIRNLTVGVVDTTGKEVAVARLEPRWTKMGADGVLEAEDRTGDIATYRFAFVPLPQLPENGALRLPPVAVGNRIEPDQIVRFERRIWIGSLPLNC